jgi:hypothetical protein
MFRLAAVVVPLLLVATVAPAASPASVVDGTAVPFLPAPPGVVGGAVGGFLNPAAWSVGAGEVAFTWDDRSIDHDTLDSWGLSIAAPVGFAVRKQTFAGESGASRSLWDYRPFSGGDRTWASRGSGHLARRMRRRRLVIARRARAVAVLSSAAFLSAESGRREAALDLGVRPLDVTLTLFSDVACAMTSGRTTRRGPRAPRCAPSAACTWADGGERGDGDGVSAGLVLAMSRRRADD